MLYFCGDNILDMYIQRNNYKAPNGKEYSTVLLCKKYREGKKSKTKTGAFQIVVFFILRTFSQWRYF